MKKLDKDNIIKMLKNISFIWLTLNICLGIMNIICTENSYNYGYAWELSWFTILKILELVSTISIITVLIILNKKTSKEQVSFKIEIKQLITILIFYLIFREIFLLKTTIYYLTYLMRFLLLWMRINIVIATFILVIIASITLFLIIPFSIWISIKNLNNFSQVETKNKKSKIIKILMLFIFTLTTISFGVIQRQGEVLKDSKYQHIVDATKKGHAFLVNYDDKKPLAVKMLNNMDQIEQIFNEKTQKLANLTGFKIQNFIIDDSGPQSSRVSIVFENKQLDNLKVAKNFIIKADVSTLEKDYNKIFSELKNEQTYQELKKRLALSFITQDYYKDISNETIQKVEQEVVKSGYKCNRIKPISADSSIDQIDYYYKDSNCIKYNNFLPLDNETPEAISKGTIWFSDLTGFTDKYGERIQIKNEEYVINDIEAEKIVNMINKKIPVDNKYLQNLENKNVKSSRIRIYLKNGNKINQKQEDILENKLQNLLPKKYHKNIKNGLIWY